jgi:hypothetical protein
MPRRERIVRAGVVLFAVAECAFWGLVTTIWWAFRDFVLCWMSCPDRPELIAQRTLEAAGFSILLGINLVALAIFGLNRWRHGRLVLSAVEGVDLAITLLVGLMFARSNDWTTALQWWSGGLIAALTLGLLYVLSGSLAATRDGWPRSA